jgi:ketosteroid isomerase-like protein
MSSKNVEIVRQLLELNRGDGLDPVDSILALVDPNCEFTSVMAAVEPQTYRGHDGVRDYLAEMADSWQEWRMEVEEAFDADPDTVLTVFRALVVGKDSGAAVETRRAMVCELSAGKIRRARAYPSREEALHAAGLSE